MFHLICILLTIPLNFSKYVLIWSDEFSSPLLNESNWNIEEGDYFWNNEMQAYTANNYYIANDSLFLEARKENWGSKNYTSGRINTFQKRDFLYGRFEARIKLPIGQGFWPAFWMLPTDFDELQEYREIDIMENLGNDPFSIYGYLHMKFNGEDMNSFGKKLSLNQISPDQFHVYSVEWTYEKIEWFVDGMKFFYTTLNDTIPYWPFKKDRFYIILNLAIGGDWPGDPDHTTNFPSVMEIDYVKVYQIKNDDILSNNITAAENCSNFTNISNYDNKNKSDAAKNRSISNFTNKNTTIDNRFDSNNVLDNDNSIKSGENPDSYNNSLNSGENINLSDQTNKSNTTNGEKFKNSTKLFNQTNSSKNSQNNTNFSYVSNQTNTLNSTAAENSSSSINASNHNNSTNNSKNSSDIDTDNSPNSEKNTTYSGNKINISLGNDINSTNISTGFKINCTENTTVYTNDSASKNTTITDLMKNDSVIYETKNKTNNNSEETNYTFGISPIKNCSNISNFGKILLTIYWIIIRTLMLMIGLYI